MERGDEEYEVDQDESARFENDHFEKLADDIKTSKPASVTA